MEGVVPLKHRLFPVAELPPGEMRVVKIDRISILVIRTFDGEFRALRDTCPHRGARLSFGRLIGRVDSDGVGTYSVSDECIVRCPWHAHEYSADTGRSLANPEGMRVRTYPVTVEDGDVILER